MIGLSALGRSAAALTPVSPMQTGYTTVQPKRKHYEK